MVDGETMLCSILRSSDAACVGKLSSLREIILINRD